MANMLAYFDSFAGLVPCRIVAIHDKNARIEFTANRGAYKRGEFYTAPIMHVVPRSAVHTRCGQYRIYRYDWSQFIPVDSKLRVHTPYWD